MTERASSGVFGARPRAWACWLAVGSALAACHGVRSERTPELRPPLVTETVAPPPFQSPAVWRYHPLSPVSPAAELSLPGGARLLVGGRGERWLTPAAGGALEAASLPAPEDLVGVMRGAGGEGYVFVGASGATYESRTPGGPFVRSSVPLEPLVGVSAGSGAIVGLRVRGGLLRSSDGGATWQTTGPAGRRFVAVLLGDGGRALALAAPEALFESGDAGLTFSQVAVRSVGAFELQRLPDGGFGVRSALGDFRYHFEQGGQLEAALAKRDSRPTSALPLAPSGDAISSGRAALSGAQYFELKPELGLVSGLWAGALTARPETKLRGCSMPRIAAAGRFVTIACVRRSSNEGDSSGDAIVEPIQVYRSRDLGVSFESEGVLLDGSNGALELAQGQNGETLLSGICPPYRSGSGCAVQGVVVLKAPGAELESKGTPAAPAHSAQRLVEPRAGELAVTPSLAESALALAFSNDGRTAYAVGRRTKGSLGIFVSRDAGRSFEPRDLDLTAEDGESWQDPATRVRGLVPSEDGTVALVLNRGRSWLWLVLDESGRTLSSVSPPDPQAMIAGAGSRALAIALESRQVWESLDAGATFHKLAGLPIEPCPTGPCRPALACGSFGCTLGGELSRIGWGGDADSRGWLMPPPATPAPEYTVPRLKTPIACTLDSSKWQVLEGALELPTAFDSAIGKATWFAPGVDEKRAAAWIWVAENGKAELKREPLLPPVPDGKAYAFKLSHQIEGAVALRYPLPADPSSPNLGKLEASWFNFFEGKRYQAALADAGAFEPGDHVGLPSSYRAADPGLLSIAAAGLYLRPHKRVGSPTFFFDGKRSEALENVVFPAALSKAVNQEFIHVDGEHVPVLLLDRGQGVVRGRVGKGLNEVGAFSIAPAGPRRSSTRTSNISYLGGRAGYLIESFEPALLEADAQFFGFRARGEVLDPPIGVPTQLALADGAPRCDAKALAATPRVLAPYRPGTRHPVVISDGGDLQVFVTDWAVLYGTPGSPCVAVYDAEPVTPEGGQAPPVRAIVPLDELGRSYLFRGLGTPAGPRVEYHSLNCRLDSTLEVPAEVWRAPGAHVPRSRGAEGRAPAVRATPAAR